MKELEIIGKNIAKLRKDSGMTQEDLSGMAEVDRGFISNIESGKANVSIKTLVIIAQCLETSLAELVVESREKPAQKT